MTSGARGRRASRSCFGLPGVHNLALWEALRASPIRLVGVRHEQAAAYAADGYARATGRLGVALDDDRPGRREHARRGRRGVGVALAGPRRRHRHPDRAAPAAACTAACCTRPPTRPRCSRPVTQATLAVAPTLAALAARRSRRAAAAPTRPVYLEVPTTCWPPGDRPATPPARPRRARRAARRARGRADRRRRAPADLGRLRRARPRRRRRARWPSGSARRSLTTFGGRGPRPRAPVRGRAAAARRGRGPAWDEADLVIAVGSDLDGMNTQNWPSRSRRALLAVNLDPADARRTTRPTCVVGGATRAAPARPRDGLDALAARLREGRARGLPRARRRARCASSTRLASRVPDDADRRRATCASPATGSPASTPSPARASCSTRSAGARSASPSRPRSAPRSRAPARPSRSPATAASSSPAASSPRSRRSGSRSRAVIVDDGGYGMLRYDQDERRRRALRRRPAHARLRRAGRALRRPRGDRRRARGRVRRGARRATSPTRAERARRPAEALVPPPTTSPNWYRSAEPRAASGPVVSRCG